MGWQFRIFSFHSTFFRQLRKDSRFQRDPKITRGNRNLQEKMSTLNTATKTKKRKASLEQTRQEGRAVLMARKVFRRDIIKTVIFLHQFRNASSSRDTLGCPRSARSTHRLPVPSCVNQTEFWQLMARRTRETRDVVRDSTKPVGRARFRFTAG